ncbi:mitotic checkpoint serine/threonine-protein kinase BUB1 [Neltuma alba]|uniref:mitotic checkpoint serine/threonine-protein kinase BUB1-like n=1 Tax=Neltuma alba TaxID=207710 RepID=UPI0010A46291|nr:mitotic checkpoint serine/threonine-protein kinase BUB1-like [Prosopis alba]XP_028775259.1 mitotic checkpoint serine/threonine-protein kinase BUB1-like [Prosopis alba]
MTMIDNFLISRVSEDAQDPLLPFLRSIREALEDPISGRTSNLGLVTLLQDCVRKFKHNVQYSNDIRFLKIWLLYMDASQDFNNVFKELLDSNVCANHSSLYVWSAYFFESKGRLHDAHTVYQLGISRNAEPIEWLKKAHKLFLNRISEIVTVAQRQKIDDNGSMKFENGAINPWSPSIMNDLLKRIRALITKFDGYHSSNKAYAGKVALSSLKNSSRNKIVEIGGKKYQIKGCAGQGGFAQVYKAYVNSNPDEVVALKIQKPAFPWEFYIYRLLDQRILESERPSYGFAHRIHIYSDCSVLICDYLAHGTLQDVINSYAVLGKFMEEVLCIYYTIEMLHMLETLHDVGIIHGDFKPDNLLIRYASGILQEDDFLNRSGPWRDQGLCLVDWGRGIDLRLFTDHTVFNGDCRTSGFRCIEMQEKRTWKFQVDAYGLCAVVHLMLHNAYMEIVKKESSDGGHVYLPRLPFKRYWNVELWKTFFTKMLNQYPGNDDRRLLQELRKSFEEYMGSNPQLIKKLKELLVKQRSSLCSA